MNSPYNWYSSCHSYKTLSYTLFLHIGFLHRHINMRTSASFLTVILATLGMIPFVFATYLSWSNQVFFEKSGLDLFITYSAIILSFMGGTLWGQFIHKNIGSLSRYVLISSNFLAIGAWFSLLIDVPVLSIGLLFLGFISTFWVEARSLKHNESANARYLNMRFTVTIVVCVLHLLVLYPHQ